MATNKTSIIVDFNLVGATSFEEFEAAVTNLTRAVQNNKREIASLQQQNKGYQEDLKTLSRDEARYIKVKQDLINAGELESAAYQNVIADLEAVRTRYDEVLDSIDANTAEVTKLTNENSKWNRELNLVIKNNQAEEGSLDSLKTSLSILTAQYNALSEERRKGAEGQEYQAMILQTTDALKEEEAAIGNTRRSVGDYQESITKALQGQVPFLGSLKSISAVLTQSGGLAGAIKLTSAALGGLIKQSLLFIATPLGATLTIIGAALGILMAVFNKMVDVIKGNEEQYAKLQIVLAPLRVVIDAITRAFEELAEIFLDVALAVSQGITWFADLIGITDDLAAKTEDYIGVEQRKAQLLKDERQLNEQLAESEIEIAELRANIADRENFTYEERLAMIDRVRELERANAEEQQRIAQERIAILEELASRTKNSTEVENELSAARIEASRIAQQLATSERQLNRERNTVLKEQGAASRRASSAAKSASSVQSKAQKEEEKALKERNRLLKEQQKIIADNEKAQVDLLQDGFDKRYKTIIANYNKEIAALKLKLETETKLEESARQALRDNIEALETKQSRDILELYQSFQIEILNLVNKSGEAQIQELTRTYERAIDELNKIDKPVQIPGMSDADYNKILEEYESFLFDIAELEIRLTEERDRQIEEIRVNDLKRLHTQIEAEVNREYETDLTRFADNERERIRIQQDSLKKQIEQKKAADLETYKEEVALRGLIAQERKLDLDLQLNETENNRRQQYLINRDYLRAELVAYSDNADKQAEISKQLRDLELQYLNERIDLYTQWADASYNLLDSFSQVADSIGARQTQQYEENLARATAELDNQLNLRLISQKDYDAQLAQLEADTDKKIAKVERQAAIRNKALRLFEIAIDTAAGIAKAVAASPLTFGLPWSAFVAATGAAQAVAVSAEPLPKAARGMYIQGKRHNQGGTIVEAEDGEVIVNRNSVRMFPNLLSEINKLGGGVPFSTPYSDGGFSSRQLQEKATGTDSTTKIVKALESANFKVSFEEFRDIEKNFINITDRGIF